MKLEKEPLPSQTSSLKKFSSPISSCINKHKLPTCVCLHVLSKGMGNPLANPQQNTECPLLVHMSNHSSSGLRCTGVKDLWICRSTSSTDDSRPHPTACICPLSVRAPLLAIPMFRIISIPWQARIQCCTHSEITHMVHYYIILTRARPHHKLACVTTVK